ncbi:MAG: helix-turn-helix transcriptional regulator [Bacteroidales bacterium]|nr:helix-turn-helix transcriptional regulator [Bacteroidales bacterium]
MQFCNAKFQFYLRICSGQREASVKYLDKLAKFYGVTIDEIVHLEGDIPKEVTIEDKGLFEQVKLIQELDEKDRTTVFNVIDTMLTKRKFKDFFNKNIAAL